jgi:hypothetical protein
MQSPIGPSTPQRRLATHHNFAARSHLDGQRVTRWRCCIFYAIYFPFATPGTGSMAAVEASPVPPPPPGKRATTLLGSPSASTVCGLTTPVPCCHTFCSWMGGWDSHANSPNSDGPVPPNAEVPFSSPQCHPLGKAFHCSENCLDLTASKRQLILVHADLVSNVKRQVGRQARRRRSSCIDHPLHYPCVTSALQPATPNPADLAP